MLKNEFEERTKLSMTEEEFNGVNALYMACGDDIDKEEFCRLYVTFDGRLDLMHRIEREHQRMKEALEEQKLLHQEAMEIISDAADAIIKIEKDLLDGESEDHCVRGLDNMAFWLVGKKGTVTRKVKQGILLSDNEIDYVIANLK